MTHKPWTAAQIRTVKRLYPDNPTAAISAKVGHTVSSVYQLAQRLGWHKSEAYYLSPASTRLDGVVGRATRFRKGLVPWNLGKTGYMGANRTSFRKGQTPHNHVAVGTKVKDCEGYWKVKVREP